MVIDSHQHFWVFDPVRDAWITPDMEVIRRNFLPEDLKPVLSANGVDGCVAVQADQSLDETRFLLELADANEFIKGVVGWVDLRSPTLYSQLETFSFYEKMKGFRHIVQAEPVDFLRDPAFIKGVRQLSAFDFTYDILIYPTQLEAALYFVEQLPEVRMVVDHLAKPYIKKGLLAPWAEHMKQLAAYPNVSCKVSGMVTEADWNTHQPSDFVPYLDVVFESFGVDRLLFGSDWPVCLVAASYENMKGILDQYLRTFSKNEVAQIMGGNAIKFYNLE